MVASDIKEVKVVYRMRPWTNAKHYTRGGKTRLGNRNYVDFIDYNNINGLLLNAIIFLRTEFGHTDRETGIHRLSFACLLFYYNG